MNEPATQELPAMDTGAPRRRRGLVAFWRGISGTLAAGTVLLALAVVGIQIYSSTKGLPGPGAVFVAGHLVAAVLVVLGQREADRHDGWRGGLSSLGVLVISFATLWLFWWA